MPIYQFYCPDCHRIYSFLSRRVVDTQTKPACPRCSRGDLERHVSPFAISKNRKSEPSKPPVMPDDLPPGMDEGRLARAMESLAGEAEGLDENDPHQATQLMRKMFAATGLPMNAGVEEAMRRMESGEDPEKVEEEMGDVLDSAFGKMPGTVAEGAEGGRAGVGSGSGSQLKALRRRMLSPSVDPTLYEM